MTIATCIACNKTTELPAGHTLRICPHCGSGQTPAPAKSAGVAPIKASPPSPTHSAPQPPRTGQFTRFCYAIAAGGALLGAAAAAVGLTQGALAALPTFAFAAAITIIPYVFARCVDEMNR